ncbi:MAG: ATPase [Mycobacterium sp.]
MRMVLAAVLATCGLATGWPAQAFPVDCPPNCDRIPDSAWLEPTAIPLFPVYHWPRLAGVAVTATDPRFRFEEACGTPPIAGDARRFAVAARAAVPQPDGQWQLQVQVMHWRGETWRGGATALAAFDAAVAALRACQLTAPLTSPSITTDTPDRMAAVISGSIPGQPVLHEYLLAHPRSSTVTEVAMWALTPPLVNWPAVPDVQVLDAMMAPLCRAYIDSCR